MESSSKLEFWKNERKKSYSFTMFQKLLLTSYKDQSWKRFGTFKLKKLRWKSKTIHYVHNFLRIAKLFDKTTRKAVS